MSEGQAIDAPRAPGAPARTGWVSAFRGLWLLTWRSRLTLRQLPARLGTLLVLPLLVYVTIIATGQAPRRQVSSGVAYVELLNFSRHLEREGMPLTPSNSQALGRVLAEEAQEGELTWHEQLGESSDDRGQRLKDHVADWDGRFLSHVKALLDDRQYEEFQAIERRHRGEVLRGLTKVSIRWSRAEQFYYWLIKFYFFLILPLTCVSGCGPLIRDELQADTLGFLITRPVDRAQLLVLKYAAQIAWLEILLLVETLLLFAAAAGCEVPALGSLLALVLGVQILAVPAWGALGLLLGQITTRYMAAALLYGAVVEMGIGRIPTNINVLSILRHLQVLLSENAALHDFYAWPPGKVATALGAVILAPAIFLSAAAVLFSMVEYHHASEMQK